MQGVRSTLCPTAGVYLDSTFPPRVTVSALSRIIKTLGHVLRGRPRVRGPFDLRCEIAQKSVRISAKGKNDFLTKSGHFKVKYLSRLVNSDLLTNTDKDKAVPGYVNVCLNKC